MLHNACEVECWSSEVFAPQTQDPNSTKEFSSSSKPPPSIENPFVHLENVCLCSAGKIDDTAEKSDTDEDEHEVFRFAHSKAVEDKDSGEVL